MMRVHKIARIMASVALSTIVGNTQKLVRTYTLV